MNQLLTFAQALDAMLHGKKVTHTAFHGGYWAWENETIMIHCADGKTLDIRQTDDVLYTFSFVASDKWHIREEQ